MRVLIAPNALKESLSAVEFVDILSEALLSVNPSIEVVKLPLADGGDGTLEVVTRLWDGTIETIETVDPLHRPMTAPIGYDTPGQTAVIELATTSGLALLAPEERNPMKTTTYGFGMLIAEAVRKGVKRILLCIGGSATVEGGIGMAEALGFNHLGHDHIPLPGRGGSLSKIDRIVPPLSIESLRGIDFQVLSDVTNPLCGPNGAAHVFGPQKGATPEQVADLDRGLAHLSHLWERDLHVRVADVPGAGAAGGIGGGAIAYLGARLVSGGEWIMEMVHFREQLASADLVITAEGRFDSTTLSGKIPGRVAALAKEVGVRCIGLCGAVDQNVKEDLHSGGFSEIITLAPDRTGKEESFSRAEEFLRERGREIGERFR